MSATTVSPPPGAPTKRSALIAPSRSGCLLRDGFLGSSRLPGSVQRVAEPSDAADLHQNTTLTPEQYVAGLTDFGPGRSKLFVNSADEYLKVHHLGAKEADVTEGSSGTWERLHYDWSDPNHVVLKTTDSNTWGGDSGHTYTFTRQPNGTTDIDVSVVRDGRNLKGWVLGIVLGTIGKGVLEKAFKGSVEAIEDRNGVARKRGASRATAP